MSGGCLIEVSEYHYKINIWEHFDWLLKTGWLLNRGDHQHRFDCMQVISQLHICGSTDQFLTLIAHIYVIKLTIFIIAFLNKIIQGFLC